MSTRYPVVAITGSSGAGTTTAMHSVSWIFRREKIHAGVVEGDAFHRYTRDEMLRQIAEAERRGQHAPSHFGPQANHWDQLEALFRGYGDTGTGHVRYYLHDEQDAQDHGAPLGSFTPWEPLPDSTDLLFYEGLHGGIVTDEVDIARHVDLLIGVVPAINLEWIQKLHRDTRHRGYSLEAVQHTILRRMHDYVHYIVPQFSRTHVNFQRVPIVDTSNPFIAREVPSPDETLVVIRFRDPRSVDFPNLLSMLHGSWMSRPNTIVVPGGKFDMAVQLILTPMLLRLIERARTARQG